MILQLFDSWGFCVCPLLDLSVSWSLCAPILEPRGSRLVPLPPTCGSFGIPFDPFGLPLVQFWLPLAPFGSLWLPFGFPLAPFGLPLAPFGSLWLPFGSLWLPFGSFRWFPFGSLVALCCPLGVLLRTFGSSVASWSGSLP